MKKTLTRWESTVYKVGVHRNSNTTKEMKQVIVELEESDHGALKRRAAANLRKIPQQLLFEALQYASALAGKAAPPRKKGGKAA